MIGVAMVLAIHRNAASRELARGSACDFRLACRVMDRLVSVSHIKWVKEWLLDATEDETLCTQK